MREKKSVVASLILALITAISILSYPLAMWFSPRENRDEAEEKYFERGMTIVSIYYNLDDQHDSEMQNIINFVRKLPEKYKTNFGEVQILIKEIDSTEEKIIMKSYNGERVIEKENFTKENIIKNLCEILFYSSLECIDTNS